MSLRQLSLFFSALVIFGTLGIIKVIGLIQHTQPYKTAVVVQHPPSPSPSLSPIVPFRTFVDGSFTDFRAYTQPNRSVLLSVPVGDPYPLSSWGVPSLFPLEQVTYRHPCSVNTQKVRTNRSITLYVPWGNLHYMTQHPLQCPSFSPTESSSVSCSLTNDIEKLPSVDGYLVDTLNSALTEPYNWKQNKLKKWLIAWNVENIDGRRKVLKQSYKSRYMGKNWTDDWWQYFDISISYQLGSMIHFSYYHWANCRDPSLHEALSHVPVPFAKKYRKGAPILFLASNCDFVSHRRMGFVRELMKHIGVDAVGKCLKNVEHESLPICQKLKGDKKLCLISHYFFYLSIENSISLDYVTEKVYEPMLVGTVPIYLGAPNAENLLPTNRSVILATDFTSIVQLAKYLKCLMRDRSLYEAYTSWQSRTPYASWNLIRQASPPLCQACNIIANQKKPSKELLRPRVFDGVWRENAGGQKPLEQCL